jgi:mono/diheme cytochrome c family protein/cytochrome c553
MRRLFSLVFAAVMIAAGTVLADDPAGVEFFEKRIRPVLVEHCYDCHGPDADEPGGGLRLDSRAGWMKGGQSGPAIVAGKPEESLLVRAVRRAEKDSAMPPETALSAGIVADLAAWVKMGAPDPREGAAPAVATAPTKPAIDFAAARQQWAFHKPQPPAIPAVKDGKWPQNDLDRFILANLEASGLAPAGPAEPAVLVRRLTIDLTGLPPTPADVEAFLSAAATDRDQAVAALVERLLASPHYGEKWGRHWLDVVRYADSLDARGMGQPGDILDAWRYRDWVVGSFNRDLPYDEFIRQQIAGDLLARREWDVSKVVATGMYAIGNWGNGDSDKQKVYSDIVDDQIDVTSRAFLGLTIACARCHDHKFDPIATADYYALAGFFYSSRILERFAAPTAGEALMRIRLLSAEQEQRRTELLAQIAAIDAKLAGGLTPLSQKRDAVAGKPGLVGWTPSGADNPSVVINTGDAEEKFITITLPGKAICVHPGPKEVVTAVWQSPLAGKVTVSAKLSDADGNCGNGIEWSLRHGSKQLAGGPIDNGKSGELAGLEVEVQPGELVRLVIAPRGEYSCDSTQIDFVVRESGGENRTWDLRAALVESPQALDLAKTAMTVCSGDADSFASQRPDKEPLLAERERLNRELPELAQCQGLQDGGIPGTAYEGFHDARIHIRGNYARLSEVQPRRFPALFDAPLPQVEGSGRLALAQWIASPDHPLTARVLVNRVWQQHYGEGIVRTANNFGKLGEPPSHPELLDWLACQFVERGWSIKELHRLICTSATYQQSCQADAAKRQADPDNRLFSRANRRKLTSEDLRDALLAAGGGLDRTLGGPSIPKLDSPRRTLYLTTVRSDRTSYQMLFDGADPSGIVEKRNDSVVAPQSLWLLNQPFVLTQAKALAARMEREAPADMPGRVDWLTRQLFARPATAEETALAAAVIARAADSVKAWEQLCHALVCSNEFAFVD